MASVLSDLFQVRTVLITVLLSSSVSVPGCRQNKGASKSFKCTSPVVAITRDYLQFQKKSSGRFFYYIYLLVMFLVVCDQVHLLLTGIQSGIFFFLVRAGSG